MDDASPANIARIKDAANQCIANHSNLLDAIVEKLLDTAQTMNNTIHIGRKDVLWNYTVLTQRILARSRFFQKALFTRNSLESMRLKNSFLFLMITVITLGNMIINDQSIAEEICRKMKILPEFRNYLSHG